MHIRDISTTRLVWLLAFALAVFCAAVHYPVLYNNFVWDDRMFMVDSPIYSGEGGLRRSLSTAFALHASYYRPLVVATFAMLPGQVADAAMWHHALNLALHVVATVLVFAVALALIKTFALDRPLRRVELVIACAMATVFAVHPLVMESTYWISGRFDQVLTVICLLFVYVEFRWTPSRARAFTLSVLYFLAACSKETAVGFPIALLALHLMQWRGTANDLSFKEFARQKSSTYAAILIGGVIYLAVRFYVIGFSIGDSSALALSNGFVDRSLLAGLSLSKYVALLLLPWSVTAPLHPFDPLDFPQWYYAVPIIVVAVAAGIAIAAYRRRDWLWPYVVLAFVGMLLPVMHILTLSAAGNLIADRYALAPLAMLLVAASPLVVKFAHRVQLTVAFRWTLGLIYIAMILSWIAIARVTVVVWHDNSTLWNYAFQRSPKSLMATQNYVSSLLERGQLDEAELILRRLLQTTTLSIAPLTNLALVRAIKGDPEDAFSVLARLDQQSQRALSALDRSVYHCTYAQIYARTGKWQSALTESRKALEMEESNSTCHIVEANAMFALGDKDGATKRLLEFRAVSAPEVRKRIDDVLQSWGMQLTPVGK